MGTAIARVPTAQGDAGEYLMMLESLSNHLTPDMRTRDVLSLSEAALASGTPLDFILSGYYEAVDGRRYSLHFWAYPLTGLLPRFVLGLLRVDRLKALPVANAVLLLFALAAIVRSPRFTGSSRAAMFGLTLLSPVAWFVMWPHPEVFTFVGVTLAVLWSYEGHYPRAILAAAVASTQNPPLVFLVGILWLEALRKGRSIRTASRTELAAAAVIYSPAPSKDAVASATSTRTPRTTRNAVLTATVAALPALVPTLFYYWKFGTPSLLGREAVRWEDVGLRRALELLFDLNLGMLPYLPMTLALFVATVAIAIVAGRGRRTLRHAAVLLLLGLSASATTNWNHGTSGPSRYAIWMLPFVFFGMLSLREQLSSRPRLFSLAMAGAVASQALIVLARGGLAARANYLEHSYAASFVLRHAPRLYNPSPEIFACRTLHRHVSAYSFLEPVIYRTEEGCHKAWARPEHQQALASACGPLAPAGLASLRRMVPGDWRYVNF